MQNLFFRQRSHFLGFSKTWQTHELNATRRLLSRAHFLATFDMNPLPGSRVVSVNFQYTFPGAPTPCFMFTVENPPMGVVWAPIPIVGLSKVSALRCVRVFPNDQMPKNLVAASGGQQNGSGQVQTPWGWSRTLEFAHHQQLQLKWGAETMGMQGLRRLVSMARLSARGSNTNT